MLPEPDLADDLVRLRPADSPDRFSVEAVAEPGRSIGTVQLTPHSRGRAELRVVTAGRQWPAALLEAACRLLLEWGFAHRGVQTVLHVCRRGDWASRRLCYRLGFNLDGTVRSWLPPSSVLDVGHLDDAWFGSLLHGEPMSPRGGWLEVPHLMGSTTSLREHHDDDAVRVVEACDDPETSYWLGQLPSPYTLDHAHRFLDQRGEDMATGRALHWIAADPQTDVLLGAVSLIFRGPGLDAEVGYWTHPDARGRGVTTEAVRLAVRHAVVPVEDGGLGLPRVTAYAAVGNVASRRVLEANGFQPTGLQRAAANVRDGRHDLAGYDLLAEEVRLRE